MRGCDQSKQDERDREGYVVLSCLWRNRKEGRKILSLPLFANGASILKRGRGNRFFHLLLPFFPLFPISFFSLSAKPFLIFLCQIDGTWKRERREEKREEAPAERSPNMELCKGREGGLPLTIQPPSPSLSLSLSLSLPPSSPIDAAFRRGREGERGGMLCWITQMKTSSVSPLLSLSFSLHPSFQNRNFNFESAAAVEKRRRKILLFGHVSPRRKIRPSVM